jgi:hypothetical protein
MTLHPARLPLSVDALIAEAKRRMRNRRALVAALLALVILGASVGFTVLGDRGSGSGGTLPASHRASLSTFLRHYWWGHGRLFSIHRSGRGVEQVRTYAPPRPYYAKLVFEVVSVSGTPLAADARIRVISVRGWNHYLPRARKIRMGQFGTLRIRRGVITDSLTRATFCAPKVDRCGL